MKCQYFVIALVLATLAQHASGLQFDREFFTTMRPNFMNSGNSDSSGIGSMVNVDRQRDKVDVHLPLIIDMTNDKKDGNRKLDLSVLGGLVTVNKDRAIQPDGTSAGPLSVTVFGIPVYTGNGGRRNPLQMMTDFFTSRKIQSEIQRDNSSPMLRSARVARNEVTSAPIVVSVRKSSESPAIATIRRLDGTGNGPIFAPTKKANETAVKPTLITIIKKPVEGTSGVVVKKAENSTIIPVIIKKIENNTVSPVAVTTKKDNDGLMQRLTDTFDKFATFVTEAAPKANVNGRPAEKSDGYVVPSRFSESDFKPIVVTSRVGSKLDRSGLDAPIHI